MAVNNDIKRTPVGGDLSAQVIEEILPFNANFKHATKVPPTKEKGFTLIELILGMVVLAIVMTIMTGLLAPQARQSADPVVQIRATELGQALMNEILGKSFDENSDRSPPWTRCGENGVTCTETDDFGADCLDNAITAPNCTGSSLQTRVNYNDVDDYHDLTLNDSDFKNSLEEDVSDYYKDFTAEITVVYDDDFDGTNSDTNKIAKLITVKITASNNEVYGFSAYKGNY
ncbi:MULTISPECIES: prepilin-type N-terminal cleavage/methylation domain-containing protein [unclassified Pseudoalteromonas]|uniref:type IV pilus modification PilV family protein n=1 Tax=unclassified Pseudoalteromonas TaxID=194690 RepID=UPI0009E1E863|nr:MULTISPECIES: prepilin-type N-terminal cleavage/methylation domain-containing protein [unclassified Pseudoalteromonas]